MTSPEGQVGMLSIQKEEKGHFGQGPTYLYTGSKTFKTNKQINNDFKSFE